MKKIAVISLASSKLQEAQIKESTSLLTYLSDLHVSYQTFHSDFELVTIKDFDGICLIGDLDLVLHYSNWQTHRAQSQVERSLQQLLLTAYKLSTPIGCINNSALLIALLLGSKNVNLAVSETHPLIKDIMETGAIPFECPADDFISDRDCKVISTPGFMGKDIDPHQVHQGLFRFTKELVEMS